MTLNAVLLPLISKYYKGQEFDNYIAMYALDVL